MTDTDVQDYLKERAALLAQAFPGRACFIDAIIEIAPDGTLMARWQTFVEKVGLSPVDGPEGDTSEAAMAWALSFKPTDVTVPKATLLRNQAADLLAQAERLEAEAKATVTADPPAPEVVADPPPADTGDGDNGTGAVVVEFPAGG